MSGDYTLRVWDLATGRAVHILEGHTDFVYGVAVTPDGGRAVSASADKTVRVWDLATGRTVRTLEGHAERVYGVAVTPDGGRAVSASFDQIARVWDLATGRALRTLEGHAGTVFGVAVTPDGGRAVSASSDKTLRVWDLATGRAVRTMKGHTATVFGVAVTPDGGRAVSASSDKTLRVWDLATGRTVRTLEGHTDIVYGVAISPDGQWVVSTSNDDTVCIWELSSGRAIGALTHVGVTRSICVPAAFHPAAPLLAMIGGNHGRSILVWELDRSELLGSASAAESTHYRNAKVVLVGDTGVGKSGLGLVLTGQAFRATESTEGRHVWTLATREESVGDAIRETRETLVWDLAGQPGYRLIHQMHLHEVSVALVVFDARSETDPLAGVRHWDRALRLALQRQGDAAVPLKKFLVVARADRGGVSLSRQRMDALVAEMGFDGYFETSAKEGWKIPELKAATCDAIQWDALPQVVSTNLFDSIKQFLLAEKKEGRLLATADELFRAFTKNHPEDAGDEGLRAKFDTCVGRLENRDLIRRLTFGGYVLLQPELLDSYASALVNAAKDEPDGLGFVAEEVALKGQFKMSKDARVQDKGVERLLLIATVEELLRHELVLKEAVEGGVDLVFPSQFTREWPDAPDVPGRAVVFTFEGPVMNAYATLAVRLAHSRLFRKKEMWKNAATFDATVGGTCGIALREPEEGRGEFTLFFDAAASEATRFQFDDYVGAHLQRRALPDTVRRRRTYACPQCGEPVTDSQVKRRQERGFKTMRCNVCEAQFPLLNRDERMTAEAVASSAVAEMDRAADTHRDRDTAAMTLRGKIASNDYDVFLCHNSKDKPAVKEIGERLKERGVLPWLDEWELRPGLPWQPELEKQIRQIKAAAVFIGPTGLGPWQDQEQAVFLRQFVKRKSPVIPVILPAVKKKAPELPGFLGGMTWVDFRKQDPDPLGLLVWGILGKPAQPLSDVKL